MTEPDFETAGPPRGGWTWRHMLVGALLFVAGLVLGATLLGDLGETPCHEVHQEAQPARDTLASTFGSGQEGREAMRQLLDLAEGNPGCFAPEEVDLLRQQLEQPPAEQTTVGPATEDT